MEYRYLPESPDGVVQLIAASYLRHGFYWYVTGRVPEGKDARIIDQKIMEKYGIQISEWQRAQRKKRGLANAHYIRFQNWFIILVSQGHHQIKKPAKLGGDLENLKDCRRAPIRFEGYSISYRRSGISEPGAGGPKWHAHVRIDATTYGELTAYFESIAVHRSGENLAFEFSRLKFARFAPVRRQLLNLLRQVNRMRSQAGFEELASSCLRLKRTPITVFSREDRDAA